MNQPEIWHHGLVARAWGAFETESGPELPYFHSLIEASGQPALDLGCGSGRLLLPLLRAGLDVDGGDFSADMLAECRRAAAAEGFAPALYQQAMHQLNLPRRYLTIFACGVVGVGGSQELTAVAFARVHEHLLLLQNAGCADITLQGDYADQPATPDGNDLLFFARK